MIQSVSLMLLMNMSPLATAILILTISIVMTLSIFKTTVTSWLSLVLIITFSSGMMTLFMYTSSLISNEVNKKQTMKMMLVIPTSLAIIYLPLNKMKKTSISMKMFSSQLIMIIMTLTLIMTMLGIATHGHNPHQTLSSSF